MHVSPPSTSSVKPDRDGGVHGRCQKDAAHLCSLPLPYSPGQEQSLTISGATNVCNWFLHNFKRNWRCSSSCQRVYWEDKSLRKQPNNPAASCWCASPFNCFLWAELQDCRYWLLLPHGNAGDRLKGRGKKKSFHSYSVSRTRKGPWHQWTNQRWKLMRSMFPFSSIILLIFSDCLGLEHCPSKPINIRVFPAFPWRTQKTIWIPVGRS